MDSDQESRIFFRILFDLNSVHWCSLIQTVFETLKLNSIISNAALEWFIWLDWNLLEESHSLCVMLEHCEHGFQQASLDGEQLQHLVQEVIFDL